MENVAFYWHAAAAVLMGIAIGFERQWRHHVGGLRTNALVAFGSCVFVSLPLLLAGSFTAGQLAVRVRKLAYTSRPFLAA